MDIRVSGGGWFTEQTAELYRQVSNKPLPKRLSVAAGLEPLARLCYPDGGVRIFPKEKPETFPGCPRNSKECVVGYSGGKDSLACLVSLCEQGYEPVAFHLAGLNRSYPNELTYVVRACKHLDVTLVVANVKLEGKSNFPDNPVKDQLILAAMVDWGIANGVHQFTLGVHAGHHLGVARMDYNWSDTREMFQAFGAFVRERWPSYQWRQQIQTDTEAFRILGQRGLLPYAVSCVLPYRFRKTRHDANEEKFGVELYADRCGSCWKCCLEWVHEVALGFRPNVPRFTSHCLSILAANVRKHYNPRITGKATAADALRFWSELDVDAVLELTEG